ncbi:MAG: hypothetical protein Q8L98_08115 [Chlamydiales bacterium]|nr:hypothetical protein [Chlamydiales bacterium]
MPKKAKKEEKSVPTKIPQPEGAPLKFWKNDGDDRATVVVAADKNGDSMEFTEALKAVVGVKDTELASQIFQAGVSALKPICGETDSLNVVAQAMHDLQPKGAVEARFAVQASALFSHGLANLKRSENAEIINQAEYYGNKAIKLLRLHNETIEALSRYRRGGEQKVTVTHAVITEQAIVNNFNGMGGGSNQNQGATPCSSQSAEQKPEQTTINHADSRQWPMGDAGCTEVKAPGQRRKRAESA